MNEFLEFDDLQRSVKQLNLDDFSLEDLEKYITELNGEITRVQKEVEKKSLHLTEAKKFFKKI